MTQALPFQTVNDVRAPEAHAQCVSPLEAQRMCNFVVHAPLGIDIPELVEARSCRPEAVPGRIASHNDFATEWTNANPSSYRTEYRLADGTHFRIKQFLFDWAPPFAGHPNLWNHATRGKALSQGDVLWIGTDYKERQGACAELARTMVELSVIKGHLPDAVIHAFYEALAPVSPDVVPAYLQLSLHDVGYWQRFRPRPLKVPFSLWKPVPYGAYAMDDWRAADPATLALFVADRFPVQLAGYTAETLGFYKLGTPGEVLDLKFHRNGDRQHGLRLHFRRLDAEEAKPSALAQKDSAYERVYHQSPYCIDVAFVCAEHGPFEYRIVDTRKRTELIAMFTPVRGHDRAACTAVIERALAITADAPADLVT